MKRKSFEEIVHEEFRWHAVGDVPFVEAADPAENANIANDTHTRLVLMMDGYKMAADLMVERAISDRYHRDFLVCPIVFNYRQFLKLSLKYMLATFGGPVGVAPNWDTHNLDVLWRSYAEMLDRRGTQDPDDADPIVAKVVAQFAKIDPGSYSYRYPVDRKGQPLPLAMTDLHLSTLKGVMEAIGNYFNGCDGFLTDLARAQPSAE